MIKLTTVLLAANLGCAAQAAPFSDQPRSYVFTGDGGKSATAHFPWIAGGPPGAAEHINSYLHDAYLQTLPASDPKETRIKVLDGMTMIESQGVKAMNGGRMVRVSIEEEGCGAYCSSGISDFDFDAASGRPVGALDLTAPDAKARLHLKAHKAHVAEIEKFLAALKRDLRKSGPDKARLQEQIELYEMCLSGREDAARDYSYLLVAENSLVVSFGECGSHASRALDELGGFSYSVKGEAMRPYLSSYGRRLLLGDAQAEAPSINKSGQLFKGTINGRLPVTLFLGPSGRLGEKPFDSAHYYYDKFRQQIALVMQREGDAFVLTENDKNGKPTAVMTLKLSGAKLSGEWRSGAKRMPVDLTAY
ncbi:hypothetical protein [Duganella sp. Root336D2]|uniref:hypothetical protein n=1 Tax=Duganella sp. Root336D2 TaxID=1736518 RepID=UPI000700A79E|nr:hypothetical protein [Duganella sp. Root336D2]KQV44818.1 hypothetical protein ASD07_19930 [Duganella sp. Root336D2]